MSGADDIRTAEVIDDLIAAVMDNTHGREGVLDRKGAEKDLREYVTDPVRRLAILNLIGDVREGFLITDNQTGHWQVFATGLREDVPAYVVVRPRGEATE